MNDRDFLDEMMEHSGVMGMHWGKRRSREERKSDKAAFKKEYRQMYKDQYLHPIHSTSAQLNLLVKKPLKALHLDTATAKELNADVARRVSESRAKKNKPKEDKSSEDHKQKVVLRKKPLNQMSNAELKVLTNRLQLEKQYKDLTKADVSAGQKFVSDLLVNAAKETAKNQLAKYMGEGVTVLSAVIGKRKR